MIHITKKKKTQDLEVPKEELECCVLTCYSFLREGFTRKKWTLKRIGLFQTELKKKRLCKFRKVQCYKASTDKR